MTPSDRVTLLLFALMLGTFCAGLWKGADWLVVGPAAAWWLG